jgi:hypothetical protein
VTAGGHKLEYVEINTGVKVAETVQLCRFLSASEVFLKAYPYPPA